MLPGPIQNGLHIGGPAGNRDNRILLRHHNTVLSERPIPAIGSMLTAPELEAISLVPVATGCRVAVGNLGAGGGLYPLLGKQTLAVPDSLLQIELTESGNILRLDIQSPPA